MLGADISLSLGNDTISSCCLLESLRKAFLPPYPSSFLPGGGEQAGPISAVLCLCVGVRKPERAGATRRLHPSLSRVTGRPWGGGGSLGDQGQERGWEPALSALRRLLGGGTRKGPSGPYAGPGEKRHLNPHHPPIRSPTCQPAVWFLVSDLPADTSSGQVSTACAVGSWRHGLSPIKPTRQSPFSDEHGGTCLSSQHPGRLKPATPEKGTASRACCWLTL